VEKKMRRLIRILGARPAPHQASDTVYFCHRV
jgi:hypothetical protein